jgi:hypothetical protein
MLSSRDISVPTSVRSFYRDADKSLARRTNLSITFSVHGTGGSPKGPDPVNRVGDQVIGSSFFWVASAR